MSEDKVWSVFRDALKIAESSCFSSIPKIFFAASLERICISRRLRNANFCVYLTEDCVVNLRGFSDFGCFRHFNQFSRFYVV